MAAVWRDHCTERELKEIDFATVYAEQFAHGTTGHNQLMIIAKLAGLLDQGLIPAAPPKNFDPTRPVNPRKPGGFV